MFSSGGSGGPGGFFREPSRFAFDIPKTTVNDTKGDFFDSGEFLTHGADEYQESEYRTTFSKRQPFINSTQPRFRGTLGAGVIKSADTLVQEDPYAHLPFISPDELSEGVAVAHPSFGKGTVKQIEGERQEGNFKVIVKFDNSDQTKKLIFKYAGLRSV